MMWPFGGLHTGLALASMVGFFERLGLWCWVAGLIKGLGFGTRQVLVSNSVSLLKIAYCKSFNKSLPGILHLSKPFSVLIQ